MLLLGDEDEGLRMEPAPCESVRVISQPRGPDGLVVKFQSPLSATLFHRAGAIEELAVFPRFKGEMVTPKVDPNPCSVYVMLLRSPHEIEDYPAAWGFLVE
jgi:hypothetical protein